MFVMAAPLLRVKRGFALPMEMLPLPRGDRLERSGQLGFILQFRGHSLPLGHAADDRLAALVDVDVFDRHMLLTFAAMLVQGPEELGISPRQLGRMLEVVVAAFKGLLADHRAAIALHCGAVRRH